VRRFQAMTHWTSPFIFENLLLGLTDLLSYETFPSHLPSHILYIGIFQTNWIKESMIAFSLAKYRPLTAEKLLKFMFQL
jgi:hypothetical protein